MMEKTMYAANRFGASAYANVQMETGVNTADPHHLIQMLYDGAIDSLHHAVGHIQTGNIEAKGQAISKAIRIIDEGLKASLDLRVGGELASNLFELYDYMCRRILKASIGNEIAGLNEVVTLLDGLRTAWSSIKGKV